MKVAILGANGQLGAELVKALSAWDVYPLTRPARDVRNAVVIRETLGEIRPAVVINTAAMTHVDGCEDDPWQALEVNAIAARTLAQVCADKKCVLVHFSTDYVFGGERRVPYREEDAPNPLNAYGVSKLAGEHFVRALCPRHFVVRTSGLYGAAGARGKGGNFVETMIRMARAGTPIRVVDDQILTPTSAKDLAESIAPLIRTEAYGLYHATNRGECSWYEFARKIFELARLRASLAPITSSDFGSRAVRPAYSVLANAKLAEAGVELPAWPEALKAYLTQREHL